MSFQAHLLTDELFNHCKIDTAKEEVLSGIHIVPWQSCASRPISLTLF